MLGAKPEVLIIQVSLVEMGPSGGRQVTHKIAKKVRMQKLSALYS